MAAHSATVPAAAGGCLLFPVPHPGNISSPRQQRGEPEGRRSWCFDHRTSPLLKSVSGLLVPRDLLPRVAMGGLLPGAFLYGPPLNTPSPPPWPIPGPEVTWEPTRQQKPVGGLILRRGALVRAEVGGLWVVRRGHRAPPRGPGLSDMLQLPSLTDSLNFLRLCSPAKWPAPSGDGTAGGCDSSGQGRIMPHGWR